MSEQELLQAGVSAYKSGNRQRASSIFAQLVKEYPQSEKGWFLLGMSLPAVDQREYCLRRALALSPKNPETIKQLSLLSKPESAPPSPAWTPPPAPEEPAPASSSSQYIPPFNPYETEQASEERPATSSEPIATTASQKNKENQAATRKKKNNSSMLVAVILASIVVLVITSVAVLFMLYGSTRQPLSPAPQNPITPTLTSTPMVTATSTLLTPTQLPTPLPTVVYTPIYEETQCQFESPVGVKVTCGYVTVPESRSGDPSRTIRLAVAVFHSTSKSPSPEPVIFLQGGPGGAAIEFSALAYPYIVEPFLSERDFITFDQRGTGLSEPALKCDELDKAFLQDIFGKIEASTKEMVYQNAFLSCSGLLRADGKNLNSYSTVESAADLRDIVHLLGYQKANLYGVSYGTRLALVTMRNHPEIVQSVILDSVVPVETSIIQEYPNGINYILSRLFESCSTDPNCSRAFPDLENVFWNLAEELDANPVTLTTSAYPIGTVIETMDGYYLMNVVLNLAKSSYLIDTIPQTIYRVKEQDYSTLIAAQYSLPYAFEGINSGLYISMMCREHILVTSEDKLQAAADQIGVNQPLWRPFYGDLEDLVKACNSWGAVGPNLGENDAVISNIPTLIIEGAYDYITPPSYGKQVAETLSNSYYFEFPNFGHAPTSADPSGCAMQIALDFLGSPGVEPDRACLNGMQDVKFIVPYTGDPAIELKKRQTFGVTLNVPDEWVYDEGFFVRYLSPFDITQVGAFRAPISIADLSDYFSSSAYGYRGLDAAPLEAGVRQANGLTWKLYYSSSNGRPVDVAATQVGNSSLIIIMFSHPDEHDALYRTLFLPMVDSAK